MYLAPADFREATKQPWCSDLLLTATEASDAALTSTIADLSAWFDYQTHDHFDAEPPVVPSAAPAAAVAAGGSVDLGVHLYAVTNVVDGVESGPGPTVSITTAGSNKTVNLSAIPLGTNPGTTARKVYRTIAGGTALLYVATLADNTTAVYVDTAADSTLGVTAPDPTTTLTVDGSGGPNLYLPKRIRSITSVGVRAAPGGALVTQNVSSYRVVQSVIGGLRQQRDLDLLVLEPQAPWVGNASSVGYAVWPLGTQTVVITGTFGWLAAPFRVKRAIAMMVWDVFDPMGDATRRSSRWSSGSDTYDQSLSTPTGMPYVDSVIKEYSRTRPGPTMTSVISGLYGGPSNLSGSDWDDL